MSECILIVGLGNPTPTHQYNRHNVGFLTIDFLASYHHFPPFQSKMKGLVCEKSIQGKKMILCKPTTYMNLSGQCVAEIVRFYKIPLNHVLVIYDDLDLAPGQVKIKQGGGHGGHNGLKSLDQSIGKDYWRFRIGIGHPGHKDAVSSYVLSNFKKDELSSLEPAFYALGKHLLDFGNKEMSLWTSHLHQDLNTTS